MARSKIAHASDDRTKPPDEKGVRSDTKIVKYVKQPKPAEIKRSSIKNVELPKPAEVKQTNVKIVKSVKPHKPVEVERSSIKNVEPPKPAEVKQTNVKIVKSVKPHKPVEAKQSTKKTGRGKPKVPDKAKSDKLTDEEKAEISQKYTNYRGKHKSVKISLPSITHNRFRDDTIDVLKDAGQRMNRIDTHVRNFIKLYTSYTVKETDTVFDISEEYVMEIMKIVGKASLERERKKSDKCQEFEDFYDKYYSKTLTNTERPSYKSLDNMLTVISKQIVTNYATHIQEHFQAFLNQYINILMDKDTMEKLQEEDDSKKTKTVKARPKSAGKTKPNVGKSKADADAKEEAKSQARSKKEAAHRADVRKKMGRIKMDIFLNRTGDEAEADKSDDYVKEYFKNNILKSFQITKSLSKMAKKTPLRLLILLIRMSIDGEKISRGRLKEGDSPNIKIINPLPLRTSISPKYVMFDTYTIIRLLIDRKTSAKLGHTQEYYLKNLTANQKDIWSSFFRTDLSVFRKPGYVFDNQIQTDGVGVSILMIRASDYGKPKYKKIGKAGKDHTKTTMKKPYWYKDDVYVEDVPEEARPELLKMTMIPFDPGEGDLIVGGNGEITEEHKNGKVYRKIDTFKYTARERRFGCKEKIYAKKLENLKKRTIIEAKNVAQIESELGAYNHASSIWENVLEYIKKKNEVNARLHEFYNRQIHCKQRWYSYINRQRTDAKMMARFDKKYGGPTKAFVVFGNWSQTRVLKGHTRGKSMRLTFKRRGYRVLLVDEYNSSRRLYKTGEMLVNFIKNKKGQWVHRVLGSERLKLEKTMSAENLKISRQNKDGRPTIINRDINAYQNHGYRARCILEGKELPDYMKRTYAISKKEVEPTKPLPKIVLPDRSVPGPKKEPSIKTASERSLKYRKSTMSRKMIRQDDSSESDSSDTVDESDSSDEPGLRKIRRRRKIEPKMARQRKAQANQNVKPFDIKPEPIKDGKLDKKGNSRSQKNVNHNSKIH